MISPRIAAMPNDFVDYYELLQISSHAEISTIHRVYKLLAARYHPDNPNTGDLNRFLLLKEAYETLSRPDLRLEYDLRYHEHVNRPLEVFTTSEFDVGIDGEANRRLGILCLLYSRRRTNPERPGISLLDFETVMSCPREHLEFAMWYLKEHHYVRQVDNSDFVITGEGADYVEANLPKNEILYRLLKAGDSGASRATPETGTNRTTQGGRFV
jgi:curved DNA-binding protein CbpA